MKTTIARERTLYEEVRENAALMCNREINDTIDDLIDLVLNFDLPEEEMVVVKETASLYAQILNRRSVAQTR